MSNITNVTVIKVSGELDFFIGYFMQPARHTLDGRTIPAQMRMQIVTAGGIVDFSGEQIEVLRNYLNTAMQERLI